MPSSEPAQGGAFAASVADVAADLAAADAYADLEPDTDVGVRPPRLSVPQLLRAARHFADVSQRELALRAGVPKSVLGDVESGKTESPGYPLVEQLLSCCGLQLVVLEPSLGVPLYPRAYDDARDRGARHWPGHLDVRPVRRSSDWWFGIYSQSMWLPEFTADWRRLQDRPRGRRRTTAERDRDRLAQKAAAAQRNTPEPPEVTGADATDG